MLKGISHVAVWVTDLERALNFYRKIPGVREQFRLLHEDRSVRLVYLRVADRQFIELFPHADGPRVQTTSAGLVHLCLEVDDIQSMYNALVDAGITPTKEPLFAIDGAWQFWISDPDGNLIEFHQFTPESMQLGGRGPE